MALCELKRPHMSKEFPLRTNSGVLKIRRSPRDLEIEYPKWMLGPGCCHLRALYVISPDAAKEAKERGLKYSNFEEIEALAGRHINTSFVFLLGAIGWR